VTAPAPEPKPGPMPEPAARTREVDPAVAKYETLKRRIHTQLVERLDMNRVNEMAPANLRNEIRGTVEHLCDTEDPLLNRSERSRLVEEILDETFGGRWSCCSRTRRSATS
jgi:pilus assembly protein CpaF